MVDLPELGSNLTAEKAAFINRYFNAWRFDAEVLMKACQH